jgi:hypothetical protein
MANTQARQVINSRFPSPFLFVTQPDLYASRLIILFIARPQPIKNPFLSKFHILSAVILYFSMTWASYRTHTPISLNTTTIRYRDKNNAKKHTNQLEEEYKHWGILYGYSNIINIP